MSTKRHEWPTSGVRPSYEDAILWMVRNYPLDEFGPIGNHSAVDLISALWRVEQGQVIDDVIKAEKMIQQWKKETGKIDG